MMSKKVGDMLKIQLVSPLYDIIDGWYHEATRRHLVDVAPPMPMIEKVIDLALRIERRENMDDGNSKEKAQELTLAQNKVANDIRSFCEMYEPHEQGFDTALNELVRKINNIFDPTVPLVHGDTLEPVTEERK